ncbi:DUF5906 domain-containing protein [Azotobacter beijerinckii]|nr:DUF5906 domain-containing protein [Azotobacter beijerinckii]
MAQLAGALYSTHSHEAPPELNDGKPQGPRYRLVLPLAQPIQPAELERYTRGAASLLGLDGGYLDPKSWSSAQFFYLPSCRPGGGSFADHVEGRPFASSDIPQTAAAEPAQRPQAHIAPQRGGHGFDETKRAANGSWRMILAGLGIEVPSKASQHAPCPGCGGRDRFRFDDLDGSGSFICSQGSGGAPLAGDGFDLVKHVRGCDDSTALRMVREALGLGVRPANDNTAKAARDEVRRRMQQEENQRLQLPGAVDVLPPAMSHEEMLDYLVWIASGEQVAHVNDVTMFLTWREFRSLTSASVTFNGDERKKPTPTAVLWQQDQQRKTVMTRTFHPGAGIFCRDPDGRSAINTWRPLVRRPAKAGPELFLEHVAYLFPDEAEREKFLDWLAHLEQRPGELPHYGWLHIAANTGTGRNWLASVLARVWRGYVAPNVDLPALLDSPFNGQLAGRVLAIVDEVQEAAGDNPYRHTNKLRSLVNAEYRDVNPKYGRQHREHNACRWLVFSNHLNALPIDDHDRRWRIIHHTAQPRPIQDYGRLYCALSDPEFINAVAIYLAERDISAFNPGERPPMNAAKLAVVGAAKTMTQKNADQLAAHWPADVITTTDIAGLLSDGAEERFTPAMRRAMEEVGALSIERTIKVDGKARRCWIIRNPQKWLASDGATIATEVRRARGHASFTTAQDVLADACAEKDTGPI